ERVLVTPTRILCQAGLFQGFCSSVEHYLPKILDPDTLTFLPRSQAEDDPSFKQIIPYVVLRWQDQVFHYQRGRGATEARLRAPRSIGIGGHISAEDGLRPGDLYRTGLLRELAEEVEIDSDYRQRTLGLINDDATPVGQVHLGIVHVFDLEQPRVRRREAA